MTEATRPHLHSDTEIYAAVIALAKFCVTVARQMPRDVKQLIGAMLLDETMWMAVLVMRANIARGADKVPHLVELLEHLELVQVALRLAREMGFMPNAHWSQSLPLIASVGKQANALKGYFGAAPAAPTLSAP